MSSPISDGLPYKFYNHFWYLIGQTFTELANKSFEENCDLCESQRLSLIRLICKNEDKNDDLNFNRPISLLNCDYKLIAKTLANRLKLALPHIIHPNQTFGIPGHSTNDNIILINSFFNYVK